MTSIAEELTRRMPPILERAGLDRVDSVRSLRRLSGGSSRDTWAFDASMAGGTTIPMVLQLQNGFVVDSGPDTEVEAQLLLAARRSGAPVARLVASGDEELGHPFLVMERVAGETVPQRILRDPTYARGRRDLARQYGAALAAVHRIPPGSAALATIDPVHHSAQVMEHLGEARPAFRLAVRWLEMHRPPSQGHVVCHGDFRPGNAVVGPEGLRAVIDWELAHLGDPLEDLAWCCLRAWRFGAAPPVGGFGTYAELVAGYEEGGGSPVDADAFRWWRVACSLRWATICAMQGEAHLTGRRVSIEMAAVGRRICEAVFDLMLLLPRPADWNAHG